MATALQFGRLNIWAWLKNMIDNDLIIHAISAAPVDGTSGTGANQLGIGCLLIDYTNAFLYINTGTKASPTWIKVGTQS